MEQAEKKQSTLYRAPYLNPFIYNERKVGSINFYNHEGVICSFNWFGSNNEYDNITFPFEIVRAMKPNFKRRDAWYKKEDDGIAIYIHESLVELKFIGRFELHNTWYSVATADRFAVTVEGTKRIHNHDELRTVSHVFGTYNETFHSNTEAQETEEWKRCAALSADIKEITGVRLGEFDVHELLQYYNITRK